METAENKINDFVIRFANVNGTGSASANALYMNLGKLAAWGLAKNTLLTRVI